ncbi:hypothetical protein [Paenibacillus sp. 481]|nr:hypothetical protein [Paenibacillus sp. 481]
MKNSSDKDAALACNRWGEHNGNESVSVRIVIRQGSSFNGRY